MSEVENTVEAPIEPPVSEEVVETAPEEIVESPGEAPEDAVEEESSDELSPEIKRQIGAAAAAARKREAARWEAKLAEKQSNSSFQNNNQSAYDAATNMLQDPKTGEWHLADSIEGQIILREYKIAQKEEEQKRNASANEFKKRAERFQDAMEHAHAHFSGFSDAYAVVDDPHTGATAAMAAALVEVESQALQGAMVNFLGKHPEEIKRIRNLSPAQQRKEIIRLEDRLTATPRKSTQAAKAIGSNKPLRNTVASPETLPIKERVAQLRQQRNGSG